MVGRKAKLILLALLLGIVLLLSALGFLCRGVFAEEIKLRQAEKLMAAGDYAFAAELYRSLGDEEQAMGCELLHTEQQYLNAVGLMQSGRYEQAISAFEAQLDYKDSQNLIQACRYLWAGELCAAGDYTAAMELYNKLGSYPGMDAAIESCRADIYASALSLARKGELEKALELWRGIPDYEDAENLISRAERMQGWLSGTQRICDKEKLYPNGYYEQVYKTELAYVITPEDCSSDCKFFLYFPGGKDDEINIDFLLYYLMNPAPDTIAVFLRTNGLYDMEEKNRLGLEILERAAAERGVFPTSIVSAGSSLGAYPAMHTALYAPRMGMDVSCVLSLDAGDDWKSPHVLSRSQCLETASNGTFFYLFESPWVGTDRAAIRTMVETDNVVYLVGCVYDEHVRITLDAMGMGVIHWALGDRKEPCELDIYNFSRLWE